MATNEFNPLIPCINVRNAHQTEFRQAIWNNMKKDKNRDGSDAGTRGGGWQQIPVDEANKEESIRKFTADIQAKVSAAPVVVKKNEPETHAGSAAPVINDPNSFGNPVENEEQKAEKERLAKIEADYIAAIKKGDDNFEIKSYIKSKNGYEKALTIKPGEKYPTDKLAEIAAIQLANKTKR